jgi:NAD(P)-dependent dehydrogenase (short-subunit alcohol dehydrogenase family)
MMKTILVTGASSGFGRDTAETLVARGHAVFAGVRDAGGRNRAAGDALRATGVTVLDLDVTSDAGVDAAVGALLATSGGRLDVVVNNAGMASAGVSESFTPEQVRALFDVNVVGVQRVLRATLPALRAARGGLVVNVGSVVGRVTFPFFGLYGASKFALEALTESYRYELSRLGVDVVLLQPSAYPTKMFDNMQQPADAARADGYGEVGALPRTMFEAFRRMFAAADAPRPHDVAEAIVALVGRVPGSHPARVVVGRPFGADAVNAAVAPIQRQAVEALGLGALDASAERT